MATDFVQDLWKKEIKNVYEKPKFVPTMLNGDIVMLNDFFKVKETIDFANKENLDVVIQDSTVSTFPEAVVLHSPAYNPELVLLLLCLLF